MAIRRTDAWTRDEKVKTRAILLEPSPWPVDGGKHGCIYAVPGSLDRPETPGFQIYITGSARLWTNAKAAFKPFADLVNDGDDEGVHFIFRLPTAAEAETIRHCAVAKKREVSEAERERLTSLGRRFAKRPGVEGAQTGQKPVSEAEEGSQEPETLEEEKILDGQDGEASS